MLIRVDDYQWKEWVTGGLSRFERNGGTRNEPAKQGKNLVRQNRSPSRAQSQASTRC